MRGKICAVGKGVGLSLPLDALEKLKLAVGSEVDVLVDDRHGRIIITPPRNSELAEGVDAEFTSQVNHFIEQYRPALKKLAQ